MAATARAEIVLTVSAPTRFSAGDGRNAHAGGLRLRRLLRDKTRASRADGFPNWRPTESTATIENTSSIPITINAMPTRYKDAVPTDGGSGDCGPNLSLQCFGFDQIEDSRTTLQRLSGRIEAIV